MAEFTVQHCQLQLERFPSEITNLQAWDAADEYILNEVLPQMTQPQRILLCNDAFGAIACALLQHNPAHQLFCVSDSYIAHQGLRRNLALNQITTQPEYLTSLDAMPDKVDWVLLKLPKSAALLSHQLAQLQSVLPVGGRLIAAGKVKDIHSSTLKQFEQYIGETRTSLAVKKARLVFSQRGAQAVQPIPDPLIWPLEHSDYQIHNHANVFSRNSLDIGGRFLIEHLPQSDALQHIIDLGCGNGVVGLMAGHLNPQAKLTLVDESYMAVDSARRNVAGQLSNTVECVVNDCLQGMAANSADCILCNPPFHQQNAISDHIAWQMFKDTRRVLQSGGLLRIVGNRHLGYHLKLQRLFGNCETIAANRKFVILQSRK